MRKFGEMSTTEVAAYLCKHINTVRKWAYESVSRGGEYRGVRVRRSKTGRYYFDGESVEAKKNAQDKRG